MQPLILPQKNLWAGFTGTRTGLTDRQKKGLFDLLLLLAPRQVQHGDCVGADKELHVMAYTLGIQIAIRPPEDTGYRAWCAVTSNVYVFPAKPYLARNHDIVNHSNYLIACPNTMREVVRSGTWATIRYAAKHDRVAFLVLPNGQLDRIEPEV